MYDIMQALGYGSFLSTSACVIKGDRFQENVNKHFQSFQFW